MAETIPINVPPGGIDHDAALELAKLKHGSNLAKCYLDLYERHEALKLQFEDLRATVRSFSPLDTVVTIKIGDPDAP